MFTCNMIDKYLYPEFHLHHNTGTGLLWCHMILCNVQWKAQLCMCNVDPGSGIFQRIFIPNTQAQIPTLWCGCYKLLLSQIFGVFGWNVKQHHVHWEHYPAFSAIERWHFSAGSCSPTWLPVLLNTLSKMFNFCQAWSRELFLVEHVIEQNNTQLVQLSLPTILTILPQQPQEAWNNIR